MVMVRNNKGEQESGYEYKEERVNQLAGIG